VEEKMNTLSSKWVIERGYEDRTGSGWCTGAVFVLSSVIWELGQKSWLTSGLSIGMFVVTARTPRRAWNHVALLALNHVCRCTSWSSHWCKISKHFEMVNTAPFIFGMSPSNTQRQFYMILVVTGSITFNFNWIHKSQHVVSLRTHYAHLMLSRCIEKPA
jgi:hypothetical protein